MPLQAKVLSGGRSFKSLVSPVISVTIHSDIQRALGFPNNSEWKDNARKSRESYWIRRLNTLNPSGINKGD